MFCDFHGHSKKYAFYKKWLTCFKEKIVLFMGVIIRISLWHVESFLISLIKLLNTLIITIASISFPPLSFPYHFFSFCIQKCKEGTSRVSLYKSLKIPNIFTLETSFYGSSSIMKDDKPL